MAAASGLGLSGLVGTAAGTEEKSDAIPIDGPTVITEPGYYVLTKDLVAKNGGTLIRVESGVPDVTIDGQGYHIKGAEKGIDIGDYLDPVTPNAIVKNVIVTGCSVGIELEDTDMARVHNVKVTHCDQGFWLQQNRDLTISDSIVAKNGVAFFQDEGSPRIALLRNRITRNESVGGFDFARDAVIKDNRVDYNNSELSLTNSTGSSVVGNLFYQNRSGFDISTDDGAGGDSLVRGNRFIENERYGISVIARDARIANILIEENDVFRNGDAGIHLYDNVERSTLSKNRVIGNSGDGILLIRSNDNELVGNLIRQNGGDGIELRSSDNNVVRNNIIRENGDLPIRIDEDSVGNVVEDNQIGDDAPDTCRIPEK
ncbi:MULTISPECIES: nitrous oxide reductase family maturation protein NosD [Haloferax]|uniref:right-handed parallel beta-helix repeat-containing protein n=1 Tax=Haloferax TaxID=2251 RepID=UPI00177B7797|nr:MULTISPECIES: right-handed parallel beta-helix repeat-containing protein [Haloferax]